MCHSDELISANNPSAVQRLQLGTLCHLLSSTVIISLSLSLRLKTHLFNQYCNTAYLFPPAPLKLRHYGALQMYYLLLLSLFQMSTEDAPVSMSGHLVSDETVLEGQGYSKDCNTDSNSNISVVQFAGVAIMMLDLLSRACGFSSELS